MSQPRIICTWTSPQRGLARETSHLYCFWLAMLVTGAGSQACALREWDHSFQALVVPAVAHPAFPPFHGCLEEFLFPTCVQRLEDLPFSRTNLQWKAEARLQGLPGDRLPHQWLCHPERREQHRGVPGSLGSRSGKLHLCSAAPKLINLQEEPD